jgi:uncharacterized protein with FMN-binding domain
VRRAAAAVIGTVAGTSLLIAAKLGVHTPDAGLAADQAAVADATTGAGAAPGEDDDDRPASTGPVPSAAASGRAPASAAPTRTGAAPPTPAPTTAAGTGLHNGTFTGPGATERYGTISVTITVSGGRITDAKGSCSGCQGESVTISNNAFTKLRPEVLAAQTAKVATVSGATYTSGAYRTSLQAAIDAALK